MSFREVLPLVLKKCNYKIGKWGHHDSPWSLLGVRSIISHLRVVWRGILHMGPDDASPRMVYPNIHTFQSDFYVQ